MDSDSDNYEYEYSDDDMDQSMVKEDSDDEEEVLVSTENPNAAPMMNTPSAKVPAISMVSFEKLVPVMKGRIQEATEVLGIPASAATVLLREYHWNQDRLLEKFYEEPDKLQKKAGVYFRCNPVPVKTVKRATRSTLPPTCQICYEDEDIKMMGMPCGHEFCTECWHDFLENAVNEGPTCVRKTCPMAKCCELVTEEEPAKLGNQDLLGKFENFQLRSFVESNSLTRWCPGRGCNRVAWGSSAAAIEREGTTAQCHSCDIDFCLVCGEEPHAPTTCKDLAKWIEKCRNESETANWILANTKPCPKCNSRIEKNKGCNHMTCQKCGYEFCWICMGNWQEHGSSTGGYYKCNKFNPGDDGSNLSDAAKAKRELDRYLHYYKRYHAHSEAQKFARKQLKETESRMIVLQESSENARWSDVEFLKTANEQLVDCRRVLKFTYTYAYYLPQDCLEKERFEYHQEMLEKFTEKLSELSERAFNEMDRTEVVNHTRIVKNFMNNMLKCVDEGMDEGM